MVEYKSKIWFGVGVCSLLGATTPAMAQATVESLMPTTMTIAAVNDGGEAGESGVSAGVEVAQDAAHAYMLGLYEMEGIMRAGRYFYEAGDQDRAMAQFKALLDLFNGDLGHNLAKLGFERDHVLVEAEQIPQSIEYKEGLEEFLHAYDHVLKELDEHALNVEAIERRNPAFVSDVTVTLLQKIAKDYASLDSQKQASAAGLSRVVRDLIGATASAMMDKDKKAFAKVTAALDEITALLPISGPYKTDPSKIYGLAASVEFAIGKLR